ncbi:MAG: hypothetical protein AB7K09_12390 [Planctomycetota bacterium]
MATPSMNLTLFLQPARSVRPRRKGPGALAIGVGLVGMLALAMLAGGVIATLMRGGVKPQASLMMFDDNATTTTDDDDAMAAHLRGAYPASATTLGEQIAQAVVDGRAAAVRPGSPVTLAGGAMLHAMTSADLDGDTRAEHVLVGSAATGPWLAVVDDIGVLRLLASPWQRLADTPSPAARLGGQLIDLDNDTHPDIVLRVIDPARDDELLVWSGRTLQPLPVVLPAMACAAAPRTLTIEPATAARSAQIAVHQPVAVPGEPAVAIDVFYGLVHARTQRRDVAFPEPGSAGQWLAIAASLRQLGAHDSTAQLVRDGLALSAAAYESTIRGGSSLSYDEFRRALSQMMR